MSDIFNVVKEKQNWSGTRSELRDLISAIESDIPEQMLETKKKPKTLLPITDRRIQWFSTKNIIPKPKNKSYDYEHLVYYFLAIHFRKQNITFEDLHGLCHDYTLKQAEEKINSSNIKANFRGLEKFHLNSFSSDVVVEGLQKMGRKEGRALKSNHVRLAITPWCHVTINENNIADLTPEDADIIATAFRQSLSKIMK